MTAALQVCVGCRAADPERRRTRLGGGEMLAACARGIAARCRPGTLRVDTFACLGGCGRRGRLSLAGLGRWSLLFAGLDPERDGDALGRFVAAWLLAPNSLVLKAERPPSLRARVLGRVSPPDG